MTQAVILAAGSGSRLYPFTEVIPKIMFPIGKDELPLCHKIVEHCYQHNISDFLFCLNTNTGRQVLNYLGNGSRLGIDVEIDYSFSDTPLGTAGELINAKHKIKDEFLLYYGDTLCKTNLSAIMYYHKMRNADISIVANTNIDIPVGFVEYTSKGELKRIREKPKISELQYNYGSEIINTGGVLPIFYITRGKDFMKYCDMKKDIVKDIIPKLMPRFKISVYEDFEPFLDIGNWSTYTLAKNWG